MRKRPVGCETIRKGRLIDAHEERLRDVRILLAGGRWSGAIYMAGYAIECLLKAAIVSRLGLAELPVKYWHHTIQRLVDEAHLRRELESEGSGEAERGMALLSRVWDVSIRFQPHAHGPGDAAKFLENAEAVRQWLLARI